MRRPTLSRRETLLAAGAAGLMAPQLASPEVLAQTGPRPNIIFIMADDLGWADLGCFGQRDYATPHLDGLAAGGVRLTQAYANSCVCSPTRFALATGRYQYRFRGGLEEPLSGTADVDPAMALPRDQPTLPGLLRRAGYATALVGKWHLSKAPHHGPLAYGYDEFFGIKGGAADYFSHRDGSGAEQLVDGEVTVDRAGYLTDLFTERALAFLADRRTEPERPFFLSLHYTSPHWPWEAPTDAARAAEVTNLFDWDGGTRRTYAAMVANLDASVGRVLQALEEAALAGRTIVVFTSDNGGERFSLTWPFSGQKGELLEGGIRVPTIMRWPGVIPAGGASEQVAMTMDWAPTLTAAAGVPLSERGGFDGIDLGPVLAGREPSRSRTVFWRFRGNRQAAVRDGDWKLLRIAGNEFLFDLREDPRERANLALRRPEIANRLRAAHADWNATMLPEPADLKGYSVQASQLADRY